jgi:hypothetical protein
VLDQNLRCTDGTTQGTMTHNPNDAHETHAMTIMNDVTSILKGLA